MDNPNSLDFEYKTIKNAYGEDLDVAISKDNEYIIYPFANSKLYVLTTLNVYNSSEILNNENSRTFSKAKGFHHLSDVIAGLNIEANNYLVTISNIGSDKEYEIPLSDYKEIIAMQNGFDSYANLRKNNYLIGRGYDIEEIYDNTYNPKFYFATNYKNNIQKSDIYEDER